MEYVIVDKSFGETDIYVATLANAKKILECHIDKIDHRTLDILNNNKKILSKKFIEKIVNKMISGDVGTMASKTIEITSAAKQELVMYCFSNGIPIQSGRVSQYLFFKNFKVTDLSFFANNKNFDKEAELVDEYIFDQVNEYCTIQNDFWKEGASEIGKIRFILDFAKSLSSDSSYCVTKVLDEPR